MLWTDKTFHNSTDNNLDKNAVHKEKKSISIVHIYFSKKKILPIPW